MEMSPRCHQDDSIVGKQGAALSLSNVGGQLTCFKLCPSEIHKDSSTVICAVIHKSGRSCQKGGLVSPCKRDRATGRGIQTFETTLVNVQLSSQQQNGPTKQRAIAGAGIALKVALYNCACVKVDDRSDRSYRVRRIDNKSTSDGEPLNMESCGTRTANVKYGCINRAGDCGDSVNRAN